MKTLTEKVIDKLEYTPENMQRLGFKFYTRKKIVSMCRPLPMWEIPKEIKTAWGETQMAHVPGYLEVYDPSEHDTNTPLYMINKYFIARDIFAKTYRVWEGQDDELNAVQRNLLYQGCMPFYKFEGVYAQEITIEGVKIKGLEAKKADPPTDVPVGTMLMIGIDGEPYFTSKEKFLARYVMVEIKQQAS